MKEAIRVEELVKTYPRDVTALDGISFAVPEGAIFGLLGPNGAGKTTSVKILTTLSLPDSGRARVADLDVVRQAHRVRMAIGSVAQKSGVDREATGRENLMLQGRLYGMERGSLKRRVGELLERFGLADAANRVARTYSGGMQRRLDIAMGLVHRPSVLFLDEPTTGLDPEVRAQMWHMISALALDEGIAILLTTHYLEEADRLASRLAILDRGRVAAEGPPEALKAELRGDAVNVELAASPRDGEVEAALLPLTGVREVVVEGRALRARADDGARAVPAVLQSLEAEGLSVDSVTVARPSLDDVYLRYTGRRFDAADESAPTGKDEAMAGSR